MVDRGNLERLDTTEVVIGRMGKRVVRDYLPLHKAGLVKLVNFVEITKYDGTRVRGEVVLST